MPEAPEIHFQKIGPAGKILLDRPQALNALTLGMVRLMHPHLKAWSHDPTVSHVMIEAAGNRAFCAGGDIRALYLWGKADNPIAVRFYLEEYQLNTAIKRYPKPYIAVMNGITMGGGVGISVHGSHRIVTEKLAFAMPETGIGLFPDVGGTYFLPRCPGESGMYLALTGGRIGAADAIYAGIADYYVPSADIPVLVEALIHATDVDDIIRPFTRDAGVSELANTQSWIDESFGLASVEEIVADLEGGKADPEHFDWARKTAQVIKTKSPLSQKIAFRQIRSGKTLEFEECMKLEYRLAVRFMSGHDFYEGTRAIVIDKDLNPKWQHSSLEEVSDELVEQYFADLGAGELNLSAVL